MKKTAVCLSPELIHLFDLAGHTVVAVDILRATSTITTALAHGVAAIKPVADLEACRQLKQEGYLIAAERGGQKVAGFDLGNSPFSYMDEQLRGKKVALTTTNGTLTIERSRQADHLLIGAFLNISALADKIRQLDKDVIIHCAGWQGSVNLEDTLFAGALIAKLQDTFAPASDDALLAQALYEHHRQDIPGLVRLSSHAQRLAGHGIAKDIAFCLRQDEYQVVPHLENELLIK